MKVASEKNKCWLHERRDEGQLNSQQKYFTRRCYVLGRLRTWICPNIWWLLVHLCDEHCRQIWYIIRAGSKSFRLNLIERRGILCFWWSKGQQARLGCSFGFNFWWPERLAGWSFGFNQWKVVAALKAKVSRADAQVSKPVPNKRRLMMHGTTQVQSRYMKHTHMSVKVKEPTQPR